MINRVVFHFTRLLSISLAYKTGDRIVVISLPKPISPISESRASSLNVKPVNVLCEDSLDQDRF